MKGDFSRNTFNSQKRYSGVRMQQGRVQLDADWNEQMDILEYRLRTEAVDFIGATGAPKNHPGFNVTPTSENNGINNNLSISAGRYYIDGMLCESFQDSLFTAQVDYPSAVLPGDGTYLAYLEAWEHSLNIVDDPSIREVALNGADTTIRTRVVAQVELLNLENNSIPSNLNEYLKNNLESKNKGQLSPQLDPVSANLQNQLYRVEIHQSGSDGKATFKWSRNNASVSARIATIQTSSDGSQPTIISLDKSTVLNQLNLYSEQWLEILTNDQILCNEPGILIQLSSITYYDISVYHWPSDVNASTLSNAVLRVWDMSKANGAITIQPDMAIELEDGLQIQFTAGDYKAGDYWLIPTRAINQIEWPKGDDNKFTSQKPMGIKRSYAPLATVQCQNKQWSIINDCRYLFYSLADYQNPHPNVIKIDQDAPTASVSISSDGNILPTGAFSDTPVPNKIPVANNAGIIDSSWLGNRWLPYEITLPFDSLDSFGAVYWEKKIYVMGGNAKVTNKDGSTKTYTSNELHIYDLVTQQWTPSIVTMNYPRNAFATCIVQNKIYVIGGYKIVKKTDQEKNDTYEANLSDDMEVYDLKSANPKWDTVNVKLNHPRYYHSAVALDGKIYVIGGFSMDERKYFDIVETYDTNASSPSWISSSAKTTTDSNTPVSLNYARSDQQAVVINGEIYVLGGWGGGSSTGDGINDDDIASQYIEVYNPNPIDPKKTKTYQWAKYPLYQTFQRNSVRRYFSAAVVNNKIYAFGGSDGYENLTSVEVFNPFNVGTVIAQTPYTFVKSVAVAGDNNLIYVIGGEGTNKISVFLCA